MEKSKLDALGLPFDSILRLMTNPEEVGSEFYLKNREEIMSKAIIECLDKAPILNKMIEASAKDEAFFQHIVEDAKEKGVDDLFGKLGIDMSDRKQVLRFAISQGISGLLVEFLKMPSGLRESALLVMLFMGSIKDKGQMFNDRINDEINAVSTQVTGALISLKDKLSNPNISDEEKMRLVAEMVDGMPIKTADELDNDRVQKLINDVKNLTQE